MAVDAALLNDVKMEDTTPQTNASVGQDEAQEPKYGGFARFEIELEFVQCLCVLSSSSPYLQIIILHPLQHIDAR